MTLWTSKDLASRLRGPSSHAQMERFVQLVRKYHPHCLLHFEDFGVSNAKRLLDKYRDQHAVFNDDVYVFPANFIAGLNYI